VTKPLNKPKATPVITQDELNNAIAKFSFIVSNPKLVEEAIAVGKKQREAKAKVLTAKQKYNAKVKALSKREALELMKDKRFRWMMQRLVWNIMNPGVPAPLALFRRSIRKKPQSGIV
jgi:hypothetical protein